MYLRLSDLLMKCNFWVHWKITIIFHKRWPFLQTFYMKTVSNFQSSSSIVENCPWVRHSWCSSVVQCVGRCCPYTAAVDDGRPKPRDAADLVIVDLVNCCRIFCLKLFESLHMFAIHNLFDMTSKPKIKKSQLRWTRAHSSTPRRPIHLPQKDLWETRAPIWKNVRELRFVETNNRQRSTHHEVVVGKTLRAPAGNFRRERCF